MTISVIQNSIKNIATFFEEKKKNINIASFAAHRKGGGQQINLKPTV